MKVAVAVRVGALALWAQSGAAQAPPPGLTTAGSPYMVATSEDPFAAMRVDLPVRESLAGARARETANDPLAAILVDVPFVDPFDAIAPF